MRASQHPVLPIALDLIETLNDIGFHKAIEECSITNDTIIVVESMHDQLIGTVFSTTKKAVALLRLNNLCSISEFKDDLMPNPSYHTHDMCLRHYNTISTFLCDFFVKPSFINKVAVKSANQLEMHKDTHDRFIILINILKEVSSQVGNYCALINPSAEFDKLHIVKNTTFSQLASRRIIPKRFLSYCKDDFLPNKIDKKFLEQLSKCINCDVQATIELEKLNSYIFSMVTHSRSHMHLMKITLPNVLKSFNTTTPSRSNLGNNIIHS